MNGMIDREAHQRQNCKRIDLSRDATTKQTLTHTHTHTLSLAAKIKKNQDGKKFLPLYTNWPRMRGLNGYWYWELIRLCAMWSMLVRDTLYHCWNNTRYHHNYSVQSYPFYRCLALRLHNNVVCMYGLYLYNPVSVL